MNRAMTTSEGRVRAAARLSFDPEQSPNSTARDNDTIGAGTGTPPSAARPRAAAANPPASNRPFVRPLPDLDDVCIYVSRWHPLY